MKKIIALLVFVLLSLGCESDGFNNNNPFIPNFPVELQVNLSLPQYTNLQFASNYVIDFSQGVRGIIIFNTGSGFNAFDLACPNQPLEPCSTLSVANINVTCPCDSAVYSLFSGLSPGKQYPLKQYRVQVNGGILLITN